VLQIEILTDITPIPDQELVFNSKGKLNSVASTRRAGKTAGIKLYSTIHAIKGEEVAIVMPDYMSYCKETYDDISEVGMDIFTTRHNASLTLKTFTGGRIRFFSYEAIHKLRGKKFHKVYFDEFQTYPGNLNDLKAVLLPTLADFHGQAWFFGTPKKGTPIEEITLEKDPLWSHYKMKAVNNPFISPEEIVEQKRILPPLVFAQEWEAEFVDLSGKRWLYEYDPEVHLIEESPLDPDQRIYLGFDFNVDPCTCLVSQFIEDSAENGGGLIFLNEFTHDGGTRQLCQKVRRWLESITHNGAVYVTGDCSGSKQDSRANITDYQIISDELNIPPSMFIDTRRVNPNLGYSRDICNTAYYHNLIYVNKITCPILARDLSIAKPKEGTDQPIKDRQMNKLDSFDAHRYIIHAIFKSINDIIRFARIFNGENV
jgi:hypothetical protein